MAPNSEFGGFGTDNSMEKEKESYDLVIVGAGIHGLSVAKTYKTVEPSTSILILDKGSSVGGVWAKDRLYPGLKTNNHFGTFEFSDFPMVQEDLGKDDHIPGEVMHEYLEAYAEKVDLLQHMRFRCSVESAKDEGDDGWSLTILDESSERASKSIIHAAKLVVATGLTSEPFMPKFDGEDSFSAPIYHSSEFAKASHGLGTFQKVALLSGAKFSWDIALAYASAGIPVNWVIRASGHGPCWMAPNRLTPLKIVPEFLIQTRFIAWINPCIWGDSDGYTWIRWFLHQPWLGRKIVDGFFAMMRHNILDHNKYESHPETAKLRPWDDGVFWIGTNRGLLNYDQDFFEFVRNGTIKVHIADITHLSPQTIHLSDGKSLEADVLICGTGWKDTPPIKFLTSKDLGLPGFSHPAASQYIARAENEIFTKFPKLAVQPPQRKAIKPMADKESMTRQEPYRLYRFMVPPSFIEARTLAFAGTYRSPSVSIINQVQALWITAYLTNSIPSLSTSSSPPNGNISPSTSSTPLLKSSSSSLTDHITYETVLHTEFCKYRYSQGFGGRFPDFWFCSLPYVDLLLKDLGVKVRRKEGEVRWWSWRREWLRVYLPGDYKEIVGEWKGKRGLRGKG